MMDKPLSISQLNMYLKTIIDNDILLSNVYISGEISNITFHSSGHIYMSLKDDKSIVRAIMFKSAASILKFKPKNGMVILAKGRISVFERDGQYQFYINSMKPEGIGDLYLAFLELKEKLEKEGLFSQEFKKPIPKTPLKVGVITSPTGAAVRDIINILGRRFPFAGIFLYPVLVQGDGAPSQIIDAINYFSKNKCVDVIICGRGGGSIEDLWAFNDEGVARAIFNSNVPIISAVGHETDFTIADFVADLRAPTPSAAAELSVPDTFELQAKFDNVISKIKILLLKKLSLSKERFKNIENSKYLIYPNLIIEEKSTVVDYLTSGLIDKNFLHLSNARGKLSTLSGKLNALSPLGILSRGYSMARTDKGVIKSVNDITLGDSFRLTVSDGLIHCTADSVEIK